ncbi:putative toxin-antitoxin system toxin component, PIN family [Promineifilum sp.]|uniref:putative toxin-antitoxin system toxin component, PIN family n=1 Tax=Promineifilum sp. TaxID=2664178 RepID=UPI0035AE2CA9
MRVLIDTNVLISYLLLSEKEGAIRVIIHAFQERRFSLLLPDPLLQELVTAVRGKRRLASRISPKELESFLSVLTTYGERIRKIEEPIPSITRDIKDDYLLAYALVGAVDYLVTGDRDLLALRGQVAGLEILTPAQFSELLA